MNHSSNFNDDKNQASLGQNEPKDGVTRRRFMTLFGGGVASLAVTACAAGAPLTVNLSKGTSSALANLTTADLRATNATASIAAGSFGTASWSSTDWANPFMAWVSGPQMCSWIYRKPIGSDAHLVGWLE